MKTKWDAQSRARATSRQPRLGPEICIVVLVASETREDWAEVLSHGQPVFVLVLALVLIGGAASWSAAVGGGAQGELDSGGGRCGGVEDVGG